MDYGYVFKFILVGDSGVGKSSMLYRFTEDKFDAEHNVTIGVEFGMKMIKINDRNIKLQIWDTAGQETFRSITRSYYREAAGVILCYDVTNRKSFNDIIGWLEDIRKTSDVANIILVGTKTDLENKRIISIEEGKQMAEAYKLLFAEISSKVPYQNNPTNVFMKLAETIFDKIKHIGYHLEELPLNSGIKVIQSFDKSNKINKMNNSDKINLELFDQSRINIKKCYC